jgi:hypothetical protein
MELMTGSDSSSVNMANRGGCGGRGRPTSRGRGDGRGRGNGGNNNNKFVNNFQRQRSNAECGHGGNNNSLSCSICQGCFKEGHIADRCWHRFEEDFVSDEKHAGAAMKLYTVDKNWYTDTGATDHITAELDKLTFREKYNGGDQVHTANGSGMDISHIGHSIIHTPARDLDLKNILHVPSTNKNLLSVHHLTSNNNVFFEFNPNFFCIKDRDTRITLLRGPCHKGLYPLLPTPVVN